MSTARIELPPKLIPVFTGDARYRGAYGGRGSGKTRSFALMAAVRGYQLSKAGETGVIVCGREFMNSLDESSMAEVKAAIQSQPWLAAHYEMGEKFIRTKDGRIAFAFIGLRHNLDSIKSKSKIHLLWVDEAEPVSEVAWLKTVPTVREHDSEIWVTWNPERKSSATHIRFRQDPPEDAKIVELNYADNPWFPQVLDRERMEDSRKRPDQYAHVWEGDFVSVAEGAYFARVLAEARKEGRIGWVAKDPLMTVRAFWDIGGTGAKADACAIWVAQFVGREIRVLDYYEAVGQPLSTHVLWLRERGYDKALCVLPHDGTTNDRVYDVSYESALRDAGFEVDVVPNQGKGAASLRIEAVRRLFPSVWVNEKNCDAGLEALGWYHERRDENRNIGLGPEHDWASHGCFLGSTEVLTRYGTCQIMNLPETGEILTPCGWRQYVLPRITRRAARLVEVVFTSGYSVKCTPDHLFLTASGWRSAESLSPNTEILSTLTKSRSISMAVFIAFGQATIICREAARSCIGMFGRLHSALYPAGATSITATATCSTIGLKILSAWMPGNISPLAGGKGKSLEMAGSLLMPARRPQTGILRRKGASGTGGTQNAQRAGRSGSARRSRASIAANSTWRWFERAAIQASTALRRARSLLIGSAGDRTNTLVAIESVRPLNEVADVWDITVPDGRCFSLANGAVVHNSDAFGLMCVSYEMPRARPEATKQRDQSWVL